jgi:hypothetical protein
MQAQKIDVVIPPQADTLLERVLQATHGRIEFADTLALVELHHDLRMVLEGAQVCVPQLKELLS